MAMDVAKRTGTQADVVALAEIGTLPGSIIHIMKVLGDPNASRVSVISAVERDPVLVLKLCKCAALADKVRAAPATVDALVDHMGADGIRRAVAGAVVLDDLLPFDFDIWLHSFSTYYLVQKIMKANPEIELSPSLPVAALLHDVGQVAFKQVNRLSYKITKSVSRHDYVPVERMERQIMGMTHAEAGALIMESHGLSESVVSIVAGHHHEGIPCKYPRECVLLQLADWIDLEARGIPCQSPSASHMEKLGMERVNREAWLSRHERIIRSMDAANPFIERPKPRHDAGHPHPPPEAKADLERTQLFNIRLLNFIFPGRGEG